MPPPGKELIGRRSRGEESIGLKTPRLLPQIGASVGEIRARVLGGRTARLRAQILGLALLGVPTELVAARSAEARFRRCRHLGLVEVRGSHWCITEEGRLWCNQMQLELLPVRDLLSLVRMLGSARDQEALFGSPDGQLSGVSREMLRFVKGSGEIAAEARWLAYRGYLKVLKTPLLASRAVGWNGVAD